jgi:POT family proton-dependent oligopeptide transporter
MSQNTTDEFFQNPVLGHPAGCSYCFTEMWERFYYECLTSCFVFTIVPQKGLVMSIEDGFGG